MKRRIYTVFGVTFAVSVSQEALWPSLHKHLPPGTQAGTAAPMREYVLEQHAQQCRLLVDGHILCRNHQLLPLLEALEGDLQIFVAEWASSHIFVHAGVVGWQGQALAFPGRSFCGKSTLITTLLQAGAQYLSDEYAAFDANGHVHPYPRLISLRQENNGSQRIDARELGAAIVEEPLRVTKIFVCRFEPGASWQPQPLSPGQALLALLDNTVAARSQTAAALEVLGKVVANATTWQGVRGEADACLPEILG